MSRRTPGRPDVQVPDPGQAPPWLFPVKLALLALLTVNTAFYLFFGTPGEALDSPAWLVILVSFEAEARPGERSGGRRTALLLRVLRLLAVAALAAAEILYVRDRDWLDALNLGLWIGVVILLEIKMRRADPARRAPALAVAAAVLYAGLVCLAAAWLLRGEWFDAYDAALWLAAFAIVELDVLGRPERGIPGQ